jgi:pimeloyl-ACP methyl ester carboxylesterase
MMAAAFVACSASGRLLPTAQGLPLWRNLCGLSSFVDTVSPVGLPSTPVRARVRPATTMTRRVVMPRMSATVAEVSVTLPEGELVDGHDQGMDVDSSRISFDYFEGRDVDKPLVLFLQAFYYSRDRRAKATALEIASRRAGLGFLVFDYYGTGASEGDFVKKGTLSLWIAQAVGIVKAVAGDRPVVVCGAGIGGWIMLHVAQAMRNVIGLVGVNASVDFTEDLIVPGLGEDQRKEIEETGFVDLPWGETSYPIGGALLKDARKWLCLRGGEGSVAVERPVRLLQGLEDEEVPASRVLKLVDALASDDVVVSFIKGGDHVLDQPEDFVKMWNAVLEITSSFYEYDLTSPGSG